MSQVILNSQYLGWMSTIVFELSRKKSHFPEQFWEDKYCVLGKQNIKRNIEGKEYACKLKYLNFIFYDTIILNCFLNHFSLHQTTMLGLKVDTCLVSSCVCLFH